MNHGYTHRERVRTEDAGTTVLAWHVRRHPHSDAASWSERIAEKRVRVDGAVAAAEQVVAAGQLMEYERPGWTEPDAPCRFAVVHDDAAILVVDKPAGLQVLPGGGYLEKTLLHVVRAVGPSRAAWAPVHRLGRGTSGLVVFGKSATARRHLSAQFAQRAVTKLYLARALVRRPVPRTFVATHPIGPVQHGAGTVHAACERGRPSRTRFRVLEHDHRADACLVAAMPVTGRPHQIRIHLAASALPLEGDPLYVSGGGLRPGARVGEIGYDLHATSLRFTHPTSGRTVALRSVPPWLGA